MITWIQVAMQRHHKWIFSILLVIIVIAFVFTIGSVPLGQGGQGVQTDTYFGTNLNDPRETQPFQQDLAVLFRYTGMNPPQDAYQQMMFDRIAIQHAADMAGFPEVSNAQYFGFIRSLPAFLKEDGSFDSVRFQAFLDEMESNPSKAIIERGLANNARSFAFTELLTGPGYALPEQAQMILARQETKYSIETAALDTAKVPMTLEADPAAEKAFYEAHKANYRIPVKLKSQLLVFPAQKYLSTLETPKDADLESFFIRNQKRYPDKTFAGAKDQVLKDYQAAFARLAAARAATDFVLKVETDRVNVGSPEWQAMLKKEGIQPKPLAAFAAGETIEGVALSPEAIAEVVGALTREDSRSLSEPQSVADAALIFVREEIIDSRIPEYAEVADLVAKDYAAYKKAQTISQYELNVLQSIEKALADGKTFAQAAKDAGLENVQTYGQFLAANAPKDLPRAVLYQVMDAAQGDVRMVPVSAQKAIYAYVAKKNQPEISSDDPKMASVIRQLERRTARATQNAATQQQVSQELVRCGAVRPNDQPPAE